MTDDWSIMDRDNYEVYQLQLPRVSCWIMQTAQDVAEAFTMLKDDLEHVYHLDHRGYAKREQKTSSGSVFPQLFNSVKLVLAETSTEIYWEERHEDRWGVLERPTQYSALSLNQAIITSSNGHALITGQISPDSWPDFLLRPVISPLP